MTSDVKGVGIGDLIAGEPTPDRMVKVAGHCVDLVRTHFGEQLDYSSESIETLDRIVESGWSGGKGSVELTTIFGAYFGEVVVRKTRGRWVSGFSPEEPGTILYVGLGDAVLASVSPFRPVTEKFADPAGFSLATAWSTLMTMLDDAGAR